MTTTTVPEPTDSAALEVAPESDPTTLVAIMRTYNQRLYRIACAIVGDSDAEDVVQESFVKAFLRLDQLESPSRIGAWLSRIAVNEAIDRKRMRRPSEHFDEEQHKDADVPSPPTSPEEIVARRELVGLVERALTGLRPEFRVVFILRDVEGLSITETAESLGIAEQTVKTRLHRARIALRAQLDRHVDAATLGVFPFAGRRCDRIVAAVLKRLGHSSHSQATKGESNDQYRKDHQ